MSDLAFILIIFFLVCAAVLPVQALSSSSAQKDSEGELLPTVEMSLSSGGLHFAGEVIASPELWTKSLLQYIPKESNWVAQLKLGEEVQYQDWLPLVQSINQLGGRVDVIELVESQQ